VAWSALALAVFVLSELLFETSSVRSTMLLSLCSIFFFVLACFARAGLFKKDQQTNRMNQSRV